MMRQSIVAMVNSVTWIARAQGACPAYMFFHFIFVEEKVSAYGLEVSRSRWGISMDTCLSVRGVAFITDSFNQLSIVFV